MGLVAAEQHAGDGDHHRHARDQHRASRGRRGGLESGCGTLAGGPLLALALEVEERLVDSDPETGEQDDGADVLVHRDEAARQREQPHRAGHSTMAEWPSAEIWSARPGW